ncbi:hypothetical protein [Algoriphagus marinus]|uniref:hypothetical protein n=1 Tax=Algoriphagus marinus TaxID=1925762 RepID=UPI00094BA801|nr:hypothetical protein [Algoriphagus marinus]
MKNLQLFKWIFILFSVLAFSCTDPEEPTPPTPDSGNPPNGGGGTTTVIAQTVDISVSLPAGVNVDLSKATLSTGLMTFPVSADGKSKAVLPDSVNRMAYLFDEADNLIMMGVLNAKNKIITTETTAQALFYLGLGVFYMPIEVGNNFLSPSVTLPGYTEFKTTVDAGLRSDILYIENLKFQQDLTALLEQYKNNGEVLDSRARQINVNPGGFQSGIQIFENDVQTVKIRNVYRRRAHAFIYQKAYKLNGSTEEVVINNSVREDTKIEREVEVGPTNAFSGLIGTVVDWATGNGIKYAMVETGAVPIPLGDNQSEATYFVRVIGTSLNPASSPLMTQKEQETWRKLMIKQVYFDIITPILSEIFSKAKGQKEGIGLEAFEFFLSQNTVIWELIEKGNWSEAGLAVVKAFNTEVTGKKFLEDFVKEQVNYWSKNPTGIEIDLNRDYVNQASVARYLKILKIVEGAVKILDFGKLTAEVKMSNRIDLFDVKAIRGDVKINPAEESTVPFTNVPLKAETATQLSTGQSFLYKWSTTGKFGVITATGGLKGPSIETTSPSVNFRSEVNSSNLEENNFEKVTVEVYIKKGDQLTWIGSATAKINVKKQKLQMKPDGITLSGKQKHSVRLYLERSDNVNDIVSTSALEYKVEWSTEGKHGMFDGKNTIATTRGNAINYQALDGDVLEGIEDIKASIYFRVPGSGDWILREEVTGKVKVNNDPKKIILNVPVTAKSYKITSPGGGYSAGVHALVIVPVNSEAKTYTVTTYGFKTPYKHPYENKTVSWANGGSPPSYYAWPESDSKGISGGSYYYSLGATWCSAQPSSCDPYLPEWIASSLSGGGMANVVITLK